MVIRNLTGRRIYRPTDKFAGVYYRKGKDVTELAGSPLADVKAKSSVEWRGNVFLDDQEGGLLGYKVDDSAEFFEVRWREGSVSLGKHTEGLRVVPRFKRNPTRERIDVDVEFISREVWVAPGSPDTTVKMPSRLVSALKELHRLTAELEADNRAVAEWMKRANDFVKLTRSLCGYVDMLADPAVLPRGADTSAIMQLYPEVQYLHRMALQHVLVRAPDALYYYLERRKTNKARIAALLDEGSLGKDLAASLRGLDDGPCCKVFDACCTIFWKCVVAAADADTDGECLSKVSRALDGSGAGMLQVLLDGLKENKDLGGKLAKAGYKAMSALRGGDSLAAVAVSAWSMKNIFPMFSYDVVQPRAASLSKELGEYLKTMYTTRIEKLQGANKAKDFAAAVDKGNFTAANTVGGSVFSPTGTAWKGISLIFKFAEFSVNYSKVEGSIKEQIDAVNSGVGTANDTYKFIAGVLKLKQVEAALNTVKPIVGVFTAICSIATGFIDIHTGVVTVDMVTVVLGAAGVTAGAMTACSYLWATSALAGPLAWGGIALGVIVAVAKADQEASRPRSQKAFNDILQSIQNFKLDASDAKALIDNTLYQQVGSAFDRVRGAVGSYRGAWPDLAPWCPAQENWLRKLGLLNTSIAEQYFLPPRQPWVDPILPQPPTTNSTPAR